MKLLPKSGSVAANCNVPPEPATVWKVIIPVPPEERKPPFASKVPSSVNSISPSLSTSPPTEIVKLPVCNLEPLLIVTFPAGDQLPAALYV